MRIVLLSSLVMWAGATLLLSQLRWFSRPRLADRLLPYSAGVSQTAHGRGLLSVSSFREVVAPLSQTIGARLAQLLGVSEELAVRLGRIHSDLDVSSFRVRQVGWTFA